MIDLLISSQESVESDLSAQDNEIDNMIFLTEIREDLDKLKVEPSQKCVDSILAYAKSIK